MTPYKVRCLDGKFDEDEGMLVLNCLFEHSGERKIVLFHKQDLAPLFHVNEVPDYAMHTFARFMAKRSDPFNLVIGDDPNREKISASEQIQYAAMFNKRITDELDKVCEGLADEKGQMQRRLGELLEKNEIDAVKLLREEQIVRGKLGGPC